MLAALLGTKWPPVSLLPATFVGRLLLLHQDIMPAHETPDFMSP